HHAQAMFAKRGRYDGSREHFLGTHYYYLPITTGRAAFGLTFLPVRTLTGVSLLLQPHIGCLIALMTDR
ncbi:hypothetical protein QMZ20_16975, partial [Serratia bockelmannii]|nr:hypothetical protein [Serratia bockelmannii]